MKSWNSAKVYRPIGWHNVLFYDGPSELDGQRILGIASAQNGNRKIGEMLQLWIMPAISPIEAVRTGADASVCGDCSFRGDGRGNGRVCYVEYWRSVENISQAREKAIRMEDAEQFAGVTAGLQLRIGAYGDPVAIPMWVWRPLLETAGGWTAYTHQWRLPRARPYAAWCMASVNTPEEQRLASALGWRTFRVRAELAEFEPGEIRCPYEDGKAHCATCELCRGTSRPGRNITVEVHGQGGRAYFETLIPAEALRIGRRKLSEALDAAIH